MNNETQMVEGPAVASKEMGDSLRNLDMDPEVIEHVLQYTTLSRLTKGGVGYKKARLRPATRFSFFGGYHGVNAQECLMDVKPTDLSRSLDHALVLPFRGGAPGDFALEHLYRVAHRDLRGLPLNSYPIRYEIGLCTAASATIQQFGVLYFYVPSDRWIEGPLRDSPKPTVVQAPKRWIRVSPAAYRNQRFDRAPSGGSFNNTYLCPPEADTNFRIATHLGLQFAERYDWYVLIGFEDLPKLQVFVNPRSVRRLFEIKKVVDPIEGRKRLIHWVKSHERASASKRDQAEGNLEQWIKVCEHLRGCYEFAWQGLNCWLIPSEYDRDRLPAHTKHAEIWK